MLFDPFEERFDPPATLVQSADGECGKEGLIGQKHQCLALVGILEANAPYVLGIAPMTVISVQSDTLIADDTGRTICRRGIDASRIDVRFGSGDEEASGLVQCIQAIVVHIGSIHHVNGAWLGNKQVQDIDVVQLAVGNMDKAGDIAPEVQQCMHLLTAAFVERRAPMGTSTDRDRLL